jgi:predicted methyltransferase
MQKSFLAALLSVVGILTATADTVPPSVPVAPPTKGEAAQMPLQAAIANANRSPENKLRDQFRHPEETLGFFDVKEDMTVVEIWPGEGWYTEILAPYLREKGKLYAATYSPETSNTFQKDRQKRFVGKLKSQPMVYDKVELTVLNPPDELKIAPDGTVDRVLTFRNVHNWMKGGHAAVVFGAMFKALKPGGILGVVEHRGSPIKPQNPTAKSGYVNEDYVIALARNAGFEFLGKSEINANPKDTKDYPDGVWTLPPTLKLKDKDREKYLAIGESDRMTLKFVKPQPTLNSLLPSLLTARDESPSLPSVPEIIHKPD